MGKIESKIGSSKFESSGDFRTFQVEDASFSPEQGFPQQPVNPQYAQQPPAQQVMSQEEIMAARQRKIAEAGQVSDVARKRIEYLIGIGRAFRDVVVPGSDDQTTTFSVRTLKSKEQEKIADLTSEAGKAQSVSGMFNIRKETLAYTLYAIDGVNIDVVLGTQGLPEEDKILSRIAFLDELDESLINYIYSQQEELSREHRNKFAVKTVEEAKEVVDDIKKSS